MSTPPAGGAALPKPAGIKKGGALQNGPLKSDVQKSAPKGSEINFFWGADSHDRSRFLCGLLLYFYFATDPYIISNVVFIMAGRFHLLHKALYLLLYSEKCDTDHLLLMC